MQDGILAWGAAGVAGALITVVWNYAVSSTLVWPAGGERRAHPATRRVTAGTRARAPAALGTVCPPRR